MDMIFDIMFDMNVEMVLIIGIFLLHFIILFIFLYIIYEKKMFLMIIPLLSLFVCLNIIFTMFIRIGTISSFTFVFLAINYYFWKEV